MNQGREEEFDHEFEGWSVWIELEDSDTLNAHCRFLQTKLVGCKEQFIPHLTLLYNFAPFDDKENCPENSARKLLHDCMEAFCDQYDGISLNASRWHFFDYPKSADNGKGFGAVISMMIFEKTEALVDLHSQVSRRFPTDERVDNYHPHLSLVYAPPSYGNILNQYTEQLQTDRILLPADNVETQVKVKSLSVWSTIGRTSDWYRIAEVPFRRTVTS